MLGKTLPVSITFTFCYSLDMYTGSRAQMALYAGNDDTFFPSLSLRGSTCKISGYSEIGYVEQIGMDHDIIAFQKSSNNCHPVTLAFVIPYVASHPYHCRFAKLDK